MQVGAISFQPYVYKTNAVSSLSLSKVNAIGDDLLASKTDFSGLTKDDAVNVNPLRKGETANFADILTMQMQMGRMNAERVMKPEEEPHPLQVQPQRQTQESLYRMQKAAEAYSVNMTA